MSNGLLSVKWKRRLLKLGRRFLALSWRWRAGLAPVWVCAGLAVAGVVGSLRPSYAPGAGMAGLLAAGVVWFAGERLTPLDRPKERAYAAGISLAAGLWLMYRMRYGWTEPVQDSLVLGGLVAASPWWWHRGYRRRRPMNKHARRWGRVVDSNPDLKVWHGSKVIGATSTSTVTTLRVRLRRGLTVRHVGRDALLLDSALDLRGGACSVSLDPNSARTVFVRIVPKYPWASHLPHPLPRPGSLLISGTPRVVVGQYEDASDACLRLAQHHLVVAATGGGKSALLESLMVHLLAFADVRVCAADLASGATFGIWERTLCAPLARNVTDGFALLRRVFAVVEDREVYLSQLKEAGELIDSLPPSVDMPWLFFIIDEFPQLVKAGLADPEIGDKMVTILECLAAKARKTGVWLILGAQNPTKNDVGSTELRGALTSTIGGRLSRRQSQTLWGDGRAEGWDSAPLQRATFLHNDDDPEHLTPRVWKGLWTPIEDRRRIITAASATAQRLDVRSQTILTGAEAAPAIGDTARWGAYEVAPEVEAGATTEVAGVEVGRPHLRLVRDEAEVAPPAPAPPAVRQRLLAGTQDLETRILDELPPRHQGGVGAQGIAAQVGVPRGRVETALRRMMREGRVDHTGERGGWVLAD